MEALPLGHVGAVRRLFFYERMESKPSHSVDIIGYGTWMFSLLGMFGFAYDKVVLRDIVWRCWLPAVILWDAWIIGLDLFSEVNGIDVTFGIIASLLIFVISMPEYVALYLYGFRSNQIWTGRERI